VLELIKIAKAIKTAEAPKPPEINPAIAGRRNWPSRFPAKRMLIAKDRSSSRLMRETHAIVIGCPTPNENPAHKITMPSICGVVEKIAIMQAIDEKTILPIRSRKYPITSVIFPKLILESMDAAARMAKITPMDPEENPFSFPNTGKNTTSTSTVELTARLAYIATSIPGFFNNRETEALSRESLAETPIVGFIGMPKKSGINPRSAIIDAAKNA
jgi:hypothetical protein